MKFSTKNIYLVTALSLLSFAAYADDTSSSSASSTSSAPAATSTPAASSGFVGNYQCQRTDASSTTTPLSLAITDAGKTYTLEFDNASGYPVLYGTGVMHPSKTNVLSVSFTDPKDTNDYGIELFEMNSDGSLSSTWAVQSANQVGTDTCTKK
jgi:hypothetical protein